MSHLPASAELDAPYGAGPTAALWRSVVESRAAELIESSEVRAALLVTRDWCAAEHGEPLEAWFERTLTTRDVLADDPVMIGDSAPHWANSERCRIDVRHRTAARRGPGRTGIARWERPETHPLFDIVTPWYAEVRADLSVVPADLGLVRGPVTMALLAGFEIDRIELQVMSDQARVELSGSLVFADDYAERAL